MSRSALRLFANAADTCTQKILVAARTAGVELAVEVPKNAQMVPELHKGDIVIRYTNAILRFIGRMYDGSSIYGNSFFESAQVDSWLDWAEMELGSSNPPMLTAAIDTLEVHLGDRVFVVGQRPTLADISLCCSLHHFQQQGVVPHLPKATRRWLGTCTAQEAFQAVVGGVLAPAPAITASREVSTPPVKDNPLLAKYCTAIGGRTQVGRIIESVDGGKSLIGQKLCICGWVKTKREQNKGGLIFLEINDGSCTPSLQAVIDSCVEGFATLKEGCGTGASVKCIGEIVTSMGEGQAVELRVASKDHSVKLLGSVDSKVYPLAKKHHSMEYLRSIAHLRPRSNFIGAAARVRSSLAFAAHEFLRNRGFLWVHTPLITASDCEGAGEMFQVTTLMSQDEKGIPRTPEGKIDYTKDFFGKPAFLTVSGQLAVENYSCALANVYTFGPAFRAEVSHTTRHLAEFWMIEPELAFADLQDNMDCVEDFLKYCVRHVMEHNKGDLSFFDDKVEKGLLQRLEKLITEPFARITYTEAVEILIKESPKANFERVVEWGIDLGSEHERYLCEKVMKRPTIVYNYPKDIKAFYMRMNEDGKTVAAMDVLAPAIGEVVGGSQREERLDMLDKRLDEMELDKADYWWYRDLRRYGSVPHSGFGIGFDRLMMLATGIENIRDTAPYPRYPGHAEF